MRKQDFYFELPDELIANQPAAVRSQSRLLVVNPSNQTRVDRQFNQLVDLINPQDCLIFNNTKVIPARLRGTRESGGNVEVLLERVMIEEGTEICLAQLKASNSPKSGTRIRISDSFHLEVVGRQDNFFKLRMLESGLLLEQIEIFGHMPLPPYIQRSANQADKERYQTVYAEKQGAVAAPTAGLHFDQAIFEQLKAKGVEVGFVTLHVGAGTFSPVRVDNIIEHKMHHEWYQVPQEVVELVKRTQRKGGRVIAVGTTSVRCLESASQTGELTATSGETDIFIYPGYQFRVVDALITNFHLSESTLLMLVSAFAGKAFTLENYRHAVEQRYRFFSYGDSMFIENRVNEGTDSLVVA